MHANAMLCDFAQVNGGKLYVTGACINLVTVATPEPPYPVGVWLAALITIPWTQTNQPHKLRVAVQDADANVIPIAEPLADGSSAPEDHGAILARFTAGRSPIMVAGEDTLMPVALPIAPAVPHLGSFSVVIHIDGSEVNRLPLRVASPSEGGISLATIPPMRG